MANQQFSVNTDAVIAFTAKLERLNKSAFPSAVRSTLNDAAFAMKTTNILASAKLNMHVRNDAFFRKFTGVQRATGFNINSMEAGVGFSNSNAQKEKKALLGMESNEVGGIDSDGGMYIGASRGSRGLVKRNSRFDKANVSTSYKNWKNGKSSNMLRMVSSLMDNKPVFINTKNGRFLVKVKSMSSSIKGQKTDIKLDFLMRGRKDHAAHAKATHFNRQAALNTAKEMEGFYIKNAEFQFEKELRKTI